MIEVVAYRSEWVEYFATLRSRYATALDDVAVISIEHVGSTAVPGLAAKPVIDVDIVVYDDNVIPATNALEAIGYVALGDQGIVDRFAFREPSDTIGTNTYVVVAGSVALRNHLAVRNALRGDTGLRDEYASLKLQLAAATDDIAVYIEGKSALIRRILAAAGLSANELDDIEVANRVG